MRMIAFWTIFLIIFGPTSAARCQSSDSEPTHMIMGDVVYSGLDALPWGTRVHVYLKKTPSLPGGGSDLVAEQNILTEGEQIPIKFSLAFPNRLVRTKSTYEVCAEISILDRLSFTCDKPIYFRGSKQPKNVRLTLRRVK
jgi:putative lipoprotein